MRDEYDTFVRGKLRRAPATGMTTLPALPDVLFDYQSAVVQWGLRRGRAAVFAGTGLGKSNIELAWADAVAAHTGDRVMMLAPLAVAHQLVRESVKFNIGTDVRYSRVDEGARITVTNYEMLPHFNAADFVGVVLDESSVLKHFGAKTRTQLVETFRDTPWRLAGTATPAPNDYTELGNHAEFLGVCTRTEMLSEFFCHDGGETQLWRLKGHARAEFWRWVASWAVMVRTPSDLGFDDSRHVLPPLTVEQHTVDIDDKIAKSAGVLFASEAHGLEAQRAARKGSLEDRVAACAEFVKSEWAREGNPREPWLIWCDLNAEHDALEAAFGDLAFSVRGNDTIDEKESAILGWCNGDRPVMLSKASILGFGLNLQHCARMVFVGVNNSWETWFQAIRRCWRFGQTRPVAVHVIVSSADGAIVANLARKESDAETMAKEMVAAMDETQRANVIGAVRDTNEYTPSRKVHIPAWLVTDPSELIAE